MKKNLLLLFLAISSLSGMAQKRYIDQIFSSATKQGDIVYDTNRSINLLYGAPSPVPPSLSGSPIFTDNLMMDVYQPVGDTASRRPCVIIVHTGSFIPVIKNQQTTGSRTDSNVVEMCNRFAKMGYTAVAMDYREGWNPLTTVQAYAAEQLIQATFRAVQDVRNCIRYLRVNQSTFKIDTSKFIIGGQATGGYIALALATIDKRAKIENNLKFQRGNSSPMVSIDTMGDWYGRGGLPYFNYTGDSNVSSNAHMIFTFGGAMGDSSWLDANSLPMVSLQCTTDPFAPYNVGNVKLPTGLIVIPDATGAGVNIARANALGVNNTINSRQYDDPITQRALALSGGVKNLFPLTTSFPYEAAPWEWWSSSVMAGINSVMYRGIPLPASGHVADSSSLITNPNMSDAKARAFIDTIIGFVAPRIVAQFNLDKRNGVEVIALSQHVSIYPNPSKDILNIRISDAGIKVSQAEVIDILGRTMIHENINGQEVQLNLSALTHGMYFVKVSTLSGETAVKRLVIE